MKVMLLSQRIDVFIKNRDKRSGSEEGRPNGESSEQEVQAPTESEEQKCGSEPKANKRRLSQTRQKHERIEEASPQTHVFSKKFKKVPRLKRKETENTEYWKFWKHHKQGKKRKVFQKRRELFLSERKK